MRARAAGIFRLTQLDRLVRSAVDGEPGPEVFHTPGAEGVAYATIAVDRHLETWPIHCRAFRHHLARRFAGGKFAVVFTWLTRAHLAHPQLALSHPRALPAH